MAAEKLQIQLTKESDIDPKLVTLCKEIQAKRPRTVIDHILEHGVITTEDLSETYGYDHPPRAIRDVRENGIPLYTHSVTSPKTGRKIGAYTFGSLKDVQRGRIGGRRAFSKQFKKDLLERYGSRDSFTGEALHERYLQIDHRVPYEISGDEPTVRVEDFMLIDASTQRAKSWSCEHCTNLKVHRDQKICRSCFWASPEKYSHIAMKSQRRIDIVWQDSDIKDFDAAKRQSTKLGLDLRDYLKQLLKQ